MPSISDLLRLFVVETKLNSTLNIILRVWGFEGNKRFGRTDLQPYKDITKM